jgi:hypothetical protein
MIAAHGGLVLAIHPTSRGFGWIVFERPHMPVEWGHASAKDGRDAHMANRFKRLLERFDPAAFVLEQFEGSGVRRLERIQKLCQELIRETSAAGIQSQIYRRDQVAAAMGLPEKATRREVALVVADRLNAFDHRLPPKRKPWVAEDPRQSLFDAAALAMTYFGLTGFD